ncbi:putative iron-sulfur binding protein reductase [Lachnospiraceae bacterium TWA4]|nr:putative iron-sulfur binding protein reductase [Lachnospiraceae bacterium TWA4]
MSIYEVLHEFGIGKPITEIGWIFKPCPDRHSEELLRQIKEYFIDCDCKVIEGVQCCGLGGHAGQTEKEIAKGFIKELNGYENMYIYCASCAYNLKKAKHILPIILETHEKPDIIKSKINRIMLKVK